MFEYWAVILPMVIAVSMILSSRYHLNVKLLVCRQCKLLKVYEYDELDKVIAASEGRRNISEV
jgi:hypothetical protein